MRLAEHLESIASEAIERCHGEAAPALLKPADPSHGDYQVNGLMPLAKRLKRAPRELAAPVAEALAERDEIATAEVAGPGFINLRLSPTWVGAVLSQVAADRERDGVPAVQTSVRTVVDYSAPNIAKEMHVGHLRTTVIGDAICRLLRFVGHEALGDNHIGDWGTQYGLIIAALRSFGSMEAFEAAPMAELERLYVSGTARAKEDPEFADQARAELAKLQRGDPDNLAMWRRFLDATRVELDKVYARLGIEFDLWMGESAYEKMLPEVVELLLERGVAREDQGAICVFFDERYPKLQKLGTPFIVRKKDGAYLYSTTDLAAVLYRRDELKAERALYVVDSRQSDHFKQLFATAELLGVEMELEHITFGNILAKNGKPLRTREGGSITLAALLDEAEERAAQLMRDEGIEVEPERMGEVARVVGIGAVKYADLSQNRQSDYRFDWDKLISFKGNASPYLQYAHARVCSIFRRGEVDPESLDAGAPLRLEHVAEVALGVTLLRFADAIHQAAAGSVPHLVCDHLYALARAFSTFFEHCPVLKAEGETRRTRLMLCWLTARQLHRGLGLLGIEAPERM